MTFKHISRVKPWPELLKLKINDSGSKNFHQDLFPEFISTTKGLFENCLPTQTDNVDRYKSINYL